MSESISRSWFAVLNNPETKGYSGTPEEIVEQLKNEWIKGKETTKKGYWAYCISAKGLRHVHMILEGSGAMRFSAVLKAYNGIHIEPTKGNKKQVIAYMKKEPPFDEKGEEIIAFTTHGNIEGYKRFALSNRNVTLETIENLIEEGLTPTQIMAEDIRFRKEDILIKKAYFAKRLRETPPIRDVNVTWHMGPSGSGKSYHYIKLCEIFGEDEVYFFSDYANKGLSGFDNYVGESILFIDELKKESISYEMLLTITDCYKTQVHCRYYNGYSLWKNVHITSIFSPEEIFDGMVSKTFQYKDTINQLLRRIDVYVYHYIDHGEYKTFELDGTMYQGYEKLKDMAEKNIGNARAPERGVELHYERRKKD